MKGCEESRAGSIIIPPTLQRVLPRVICGAVSPQNKDAVDWGWQGFLAFGAQTYVVIVDPVTLQCAQTLGKHKSHVTKVKWRRTQHYHQLSAPYTLVLASADLNGTIHIWNAVQGEVVATLQDGNRQIGELEWLGGQDGSEYLLAALHPPYTLILWDTRHSTKVWKKSYTENLLSFSFDPFHFNKIAFHCQGCILMVEDFNLSKCPSSNGTRYYLSSPNQSPARSNSSTFYVNLEDREKSNVFRKRVRELIAGDAKSKAEELIQSWDILQLAFHQSMHDELIVLYSKELLIVDLTIKQTIGIIPIDKGMSPFTRVISCWQRDVIYTLQESGSVSGYFRVSQPSSGFRDSPGKDDISIDPFSDKIYDRKCHSEPLRLTKSNRPVAIALSPVSENQLALILGDGRVVFQELKFHSKRGFRSMNRYSKGGSSHHIPSDFILSIKDNYFCSESGDTGGLMMPFVSLSQMVKSIHDDNDFIRDYLSKDIALRILTTGLMPSLSGPPVVIRMCPPLTTRNISVYVPLLAIGTQMGTVQVMNLATGVIEREFSLHTYPVRGIEWTSLSSFLSFAHQPLTNSQGRVRNELIHTDTKTCYSITLRGNKSEESSIDMIRVSYLKQYFIVVLKDDPFELWDCRTLTLLRTMPRRFPKVCALEWSQSGPSKIYKDTVPADVSNKPESDSPSESSVTSSAMKESLSTMSIADLGDKIIKENLVFTDGEGRLYKFSIEGNVIKDGNKNPPDSQMNTITFIARKGNEVVLGDSDGTLAILDLKEKSSRHVSTHRGWIRKMRFAPGKDNMKLLILFADGVDIWDMKSVILVSQMKSPKSIVKILDIEWGASDRPVLATIDGCIRVMDMQLQAACSHINQYYTKDPIVSPYLVKSEAALNLRTMLIHQPWKENYSLAVSEEDGFDCVQIKDIESWLSRLPVDVSSYLIKCNSVAHRALITAYLFGDEGEIKFWSVAGQYLSMYSRDNKLTPKSKDDSEAIVKNSVTGLCTPALGSSFYHLCENSVYKRQECERLFAYERKDLSGELRETLGRRLAVIGERDRVVRLLLDTDSSHNSFYPDCLRACLISASHHSTQAASTIKLVATNLIAAGNIWEGIELLCIIGKAVDACRYLQSYGQWDDSIWLAKCVLSPTESKDIVRRWSNHLFSSGRKDLGVRTLISLGSFPSALESLVQQHHHQRAALLLEAAKELNFLNEMNYSSKEKSGDASQSPLSSVVSSLPQNIYRKYVLYLFGFGNHPAVQYFCNRMGELGKELMQELESL